MLTDRPDAPTNGILGETFDSQAAGITFRVPAGMGSKMFTHLASRSVFIDEDRYLGEEWLAHWMAHELGHLAANSVREEDAERIAREYRIRWQAAAQKSRSSGIANQPSCEETVLGSH